MKSKKLETQKKYDKKVSDFKKTKKAIENETGLTKLCLVCSKLKSPDSVKKFIDWNSVPLEFKVLMRVSDNEPSVCYYCKQLYRKGKIPKTNQVSNCLMEDRFLNSKKTRIIIDKQIEKFNEFISELGKIRMNIWQGNSSKRRLEYILSQIEESQCVNLQLTILKYPTKKAIQHCLGYLALQNLLNLLLKMKRNKI